MRVEMKTHFGASRETGWMRANEGSASVCDGLRHCGSNGLAEAEVYRFPNQLCPDHRRTINQRWRAGTLTGLP